MFIERSITYTIAIYQISGPGWYEGPKESNVVVGEGEPEDLMITAEEALEKIIGQLDNEIETAEKQRRPGDAAAPAKEIEILPGFPEQVKGEIVFCDADVSSIGPCYPKVGEYTKGSRT